MPSFGNATSIYFTGNSLVASLDVASSRRRQLAASCAHASVIPDICIGLTFIGARVHASVYLPRGSVGCPFAGSLMLRYARTSERGNGRAGGWTSAMLFTCSFTTRPFHVHTRYRSPTTSSSYSISASASSILDPIACAFINHWSANVVMTEVLGHVAYSLSTDTTLPNIGIVDDRKVDRGNADRLEILKSTGSDLKVNKIRLQHTHDSLRLIVHQYDSLRFFRRDGFSII